MNTEQELYFSKLKSAVANTFLSEHAAPDAIDAWKGDTIIDFQEDLFSKVKAKVSEKWFYTYFKNTPEKLPRIDMLNLLSVYVGYKNWNDFKNSQNDVHKIPAKKLNRWKTYIIVAILIIPIFLYIKFSTTQDNSFHFCFVDSIKNESITNIALDIKVLQEDESPLYFKTDSLGCFSYKTHEDRIRFVVQSPFHKTDTIVRSIAVNDNQTVKLTTDDYALMLNYYTNGNVKDWNTHKARLMEMIADDAQIYQLYQNSMGIELYTKEEFVRLLTIPTSSLKHLKLLDKTLKNGKIVTVKFILK